MERRHPRAAVSAFGWTLVSLLAGAALVGCGGSADAGSAVSDLVVDDGRLPSLEEAAATDAWWLAPPGCEGMLAEGDSIAIASAEHGLVAAIDPTGEIVCVDTVEAVGEELDDLGRHDDAVALSTRFTASSAAILGVTPPPEAAVDHERYAGDPHPEPNDCLSCGDPHPEPNMPVH